ncbi:MAG: glycosyltransferase [Candidatus Omnitrophica bacterium]|nr:glycosyltransferase [Candidatus Omnitrophota bacterium]
MSKKIAIVHDWLTGMRGGEKVLEVLCELFPRAHLFTLIHNKGSVSQAIEALPVHTSFLQRFPCVAQGYRNYLPLFPLAIESFDLKGFDLIISSSHCVAKGAKKPQGATHLCYCYTPMRYVWAFFEQYFGSSFYLKRKCIAAVGEYLKAWDIATLDRVDEFVAISKTIQARIKTIYKEESKVIYPPVDVERFTVDPAVGRDDFYLCVSALVPYKRIDVIVEAFNALHDKKLIIVGDGNSRRELEKKRISDNILFLGWVGHNDLLALYRRAKAFIYAAEEDFGIAPLEAQATGTPVIAYGKGGVSETIVPLNGAFKNSDPTGLFFFEQKSEALIDVINEFEKNMHQFSSLPIRQNALRFSRETFKNTIRNFIEQRMGKL